MSYYLSFVILADNKLHLPLICLDAVQLRDRQIENKLGTNFFLLIFLNNKRLIENVTVQLDRQRIKQNEKSGKSLIPPPPPDPVFKSYNTSLVVIGSTCSLPAIFLETTLLETPLKLSSSCSWLPIRQSSGFSIDRRDGGLHSNSNMEDIPPSC